MMNKMSQIEKNMLEFQRKELERLKNLLGRDGDLAELNAALCRAIRAGEIDGQREALLAHLRRTAEDKIALANPRYLVKRG